MMYKFMEMPDKTEITHSDMRDDGTVKVCFEQPVADGFKTGYWELPSYRNFDVDGYDEAELFEQRKYLESMAHLIIRFSRNGGFENAAVFLNGSIPRLLLVGRVRATGACSCAYFDRRADEGV